MDRFLAEALSHKIKIAPLNIVRENIEVSILFTLSESSIAGRLIFYGGTALRLAYGSVRFSEDLDFLMIKKVSKEELELLLKEFQKKVLNVEIKEVFEKRNTLFALINISNEILKHPINVKIEICKKKNDVDAEYIPLVSECSHLRPIVYTATINSLKKLKIETIKHRDDPKDWFDLWYIYKYLKEEVVYPKKIPFNKREFERELKRFLPQNYWNLINQVYEGK